MHRSINKFFAYLLAILLVIVPLQAAVSVPSGGDAHAAMMAMADSEEMAAMSEMAGTSSPCAQTDDCHNQGCAFVHSVTCITDLFSTTANFSIITLRVDMPELRVQFISQNLSSLFRPPKA